MVKDPKMTQTYKDDINLLNPYTLQGKIHFTIVLSK